MSHRHHSFDREVTRVLFLVLAVWVMQFLGIDELTTCQPELEKTKFSSLRIVSLMFPLNPQFHDMEKLSPSRAHHEFI